MQPCMAFFGTCSVRALFCWRRACLHLKLPAFCGDTSRDAQGTTLCLIPRAGNPCTLPDPGNDSEVPLHCDAFSSASGLRQSYRFTEPSVRTVPHTHPHTHPFLQKATETAFLFIYLMGRPFLVSPLDGRVRLV